MAKISKLVAFVFLLQFVCPSTLASTKVQTIGTLIQAQVVHRHGDRNPTRTYPTDPYEDEATFWPDGYGQLTDLGREQHYNLGAFLRQRYDQFLQKRYSKFEISATSSDKGRTIMSAQATLAGLFPPQNDAKAWNPYINWQLVPIHTIPRFNDSILHLKAPCPRFERDFKQFYETSNFVQNLEAEHMPMIKYVRSQMGLPEDTTLQQMLTYQDTLMIQNQRGMKRPAWLNQTIFDELSSLRYFQYETETYTPEFKRLKGGPMLKELLGNMHNKSNVAKKFYLYSGHEGTIGALMNTLGIFNHIPPPYASALMFELHKAGPGNIQGTDDDEYFLQIYFRNDSQSQPYLMDIPNCDQPCSLKHFSSLTDRYVPKDWLQECELPPNQNAMLNTKSVSSTLTAVLTIAALLLMLIAVVFITRKISTKKRLLDEFTPLQSHKYR